MPLGERIVAKKPTKKHRGDDRMPPSAAAAVSTPKPKAGGGGVLGFPEIGSDYEVIIAADGEEPRIADGSEPIEIQLADGSVEIDLNPQPDLEKDTKFGDNLAEKLPESVLNDISTTLLEAIEVDESDRKEWLQQRADGLELLGMKIERPSVGGTGSASTAVQGQIMVRDPILAEAIDRFQANAYAELCPSRGPVKVINYGSGNTDNDKLANDFEKDFNFYLASGADGTATEYYPDTRAMLWWIGYSSGMFKKVYRCPIRQRPVSESVDGEYLIIPSNATDLQNAGRITHEIRMRPSIMKRMQLAGSYRDVPLQTPNYTPNVLERAKDDVAGLTHTQARDADEDYTVYECYCELNIPGFEHKEGGKETGLPLPYRVAIDRDSRVVLEIRRNWDETDENEKAKIPFILFPYATGISIYGTGLLQRLGNQAIALTAIERELIDAGMFASFPGFLISQLGTRQKNSDLRVPPGGGVPVDTSATNGDITKAIMPLPYKEPAPALVQMRAQMREEAFRYGNMADLPVGEGRQDAPVGTTLAMIEQGAKVVSGILKDLHAAQKRELNMLKELFREDPDMLWNGNRRPAMGADRAERMQRWREALENCELIPASDPNSPSDLHRAGKAQLLKQLTMGNPLYNQLAVDRRICDMFGIDDFDAFVAPPQQMQPDPMMVAQIQIKAQELQMKQQKMMLDAQNQKAQLESRESVEAMKIAAKGTEHKDPFRSHELELKNRALGLQEAKMAVDSHDSQADRQSREAIEAMKIAATVGVHPEANEVVDEQLRQMQSFLSPASKNGSAPGMSDGGPVSGEIMPPADDDIDLAVAITRFLRDYKPRLS